jgi:UDP-N-acetylmuramoylalanine-D-glutamate ligase
MNTNTIISQTKIRIAILGSGESGVGSAILAKAKGYDVFVSDKNIISEKYNFLFKKKKKKVSCLFFTKNKIYLQTF